jgi:meso-butanediol dehydrogenase/(S,S)-butanediol dehydrogenase/diacetyl reductase
MARTAIITGAAQGIGKAIALRLVEDGCNVVLNDLSSKQVSIQALADEINIARTTSSEVGELVATYVLGDVTLEADVKKMIELAVATFGALDIVCLPVLLQSF